MLGFGPLASRPLSAQTAKGATASVTLALTGNKATSKVGVVTYSGASNLTLAITGNHATGAVHAVGEQASLSTIVGNKATSKAGTVTTSNASVKTLSGNKAIGRIGTAGASASAAIPGNKALGKVGGIAVEGTTVGLTQNRATSRVGAVGASANGTANITQVHATGRVGSVTATATSNIVLAGNKATGRTGQITDTRVVAISGNKATTRVGIASSRASLGVTGVRGTGVVHSTLGGFSGLAGNKATGTVHGFGSTTGGGGGSGVPTIAFTPLSLLGYDPQPVLAVPVTINGRTYALSPPQLSTAIWALAPISYTIADTASPFVYMSVVDSVTGNPEPTQPVSWTSTLVSGDPSAQLAISPSAAALGLTPGYAGVPDMAAVQVGFPSALTPFTSTLIGTYADGSTIQGAATFTVDDPSQAGGHTGEVTMGSSGAGGTTIAGVQFTLYPTGNKARSKVGSWALGPRDGPPVLVTTDIISQLVVKSASQTVATTAIDNILAIITPVNVSAG